MAEISMTNPDKNKTETRIVNTSVRSDARSYAIFDQYKPLKAGEIRLLELLPLKNSSLFEKWRNRVQCNIVHSDLDNSHIQYEALSYCWGDAKPMQSITIVNYGNHEFQVTDSILEALQLFRLPDRGRMIWADFLCINQKDEAEKSQQVARMTDVYQKASQVLGWLGPASKGDDSTFKLAEYLTQRQHEPAHNEKADRPPKPKHGKEAIREEEKEAENLFLLMNLPAFFSKPFFSRIWIIQEIAVASKLRLHCGKHQMTWDAFRDLLDRILEQYGDVLNTENTDTGLERIFMLLSTRNLVSEHISKRDETILSFFTYQPSRMDRRRSKPNVEPDDLARFVSHSRAFGSTDARDRIFGLRGLVPERSRLLDPDYSAENSADKVFREFTLWTIDETKSLNLLAQAGLHENDLPSWVPDFSRRLPHRPLDIENYSTNSQPFEPNHRSSPNVLRVSGYKIGTIRELIPGFENSGNLDFDETKTSQKWQAGTDPPPQASQIFERLMTNTFGIVQPLYHASKIDTKNIKLSDLTDLGNSLATAGTSLYDLFTKKTTRITPTLEQSWRTLSTLNDTRPTIPQQAYHETLVGGVTSLDLPPSLTTKYLSDLYSIWVDNIKSNPWKIRHWPTSDTSKFTVPVELRMLSADTERSPDSKKTTSIFDRSRTETKPKPWFGDYVVDAKNYLQKFRSADRKDESGEETMTELDRKIKEYQNRPVAEQREHNNHMKPTLSRIINRQVERMSRGRKFGVVTTTSTDDREQEKKGNGLGLVWVPEYASKDDEVWILVGASVPLVLRAVHRITAGEGRGGRGREGEENEERRKTYRLVGEAYYHGIMNGEYFTGEYREKYPGLVESVRREDIELI